MPYLGNGLTKFTTADDLTVSGTSELKDNVTVTGDVTASGTLLPTGDTAAGDDAAIGFTSAEGLILTGQGSSSDITLKNDADATVFSVPTGQQKILFPDNARALFGDGSDLQIYHDGSDSYINDTGTGNLRLAGASQVDIISSGGEFMAKFVADGASTLYHDNAAKLATTSSGVSVTGGITVSNNILETAGTTSIRPAGTEIVTITNTGDITVKGQGSSRAMMVLQAGSNTSNSQLRFGDQAVDSAGRILYDHSSNFMRFDTNEAEKMRLDSSGNLLVGKTASNIATDGIELRANDDVLITKTNATALYLNRKTGDGEIIEFRKDGANCGEIGTVAGDLYIANAVDVGLYFDSTTTDHVAPCNIDGSKRDAAIDLGASGTRFKDGYFSGQVLAQFFTGVGDTDTYMDISSNPANTIKFYTGGSERARFDNAGNFQVGASTNNYTAQSGFGVNNSGSTYAFISHPNGAPDSAVYTIFSYNGGVIGSISQSGTTAVSYNTGSDRRLKSNIQDSASASDKIDAIQVRQFDWNADNSHQDYGLIAQELQPIAPLAVTGDADSDEMMGVDYSKLVPMLLKEIQQLRGRVAILEAS